MKPRTLLHVAALLSTGPLVGLLCLLAALPAVWAVALTAAVGVVLPVAQLLWERRHTQRRAEQTEAFIQRLIDVIPEPVYVKDAGGRYVVINEAFATQRSQPRAAILGKTALELAPDARTAALVTQEDAEVLAGKAIYKEDAVKHPINGEARYRIVTKGSCLNASGEPVIIGANFDITRLHTAEQQLKSALAEQTAAAQRTRAFIQHLIDVIPYPLYIRDAQSRYRWVNSARAERHRMSKEEMIGRTQMELQPERPESLISIREDQQVLAGLRIHKEESLRKPGTEEPNYQIVIKGSCPDPDGEPVIVGINIDVTELRQSEQQLAATLAQLRAHHDRTLEFVQRLLDLLPYPVYVKDAQSRYLMVNEAMARDAFMAREELIEQMGLSDGATPERMRELFEEDGRVLAGERILREEQLPHPHTGREVFRILSKGTCVNALDEPVIVGASIDLTDLRLAERELKASLERETSLRERTEAFVQRLIDVIPDPVYVKKNGRYLLINEAFADYQARPREELLLPENAFPHLSAESRQRSEQEDRMVMEGGEVTREEHTTRRATGEEVYRIVTKRGCQYIDGERVIVGIDHHITRWRVAERELQRLAREDALTGLANRRHFRDEAERTIARSSRYEEALSLIMLDIDHFKRINDSRGHNIGDEVLKETVQRCLGGLRGTDLLARWGGEEFIALLPHTPLAEALQVAERLRETLAASPIASSSGPVPATLSGGVAQWQSGETLDALVSRADAALYRAKQEGRNRILPTRMA